ncbi:MAG: bis-aminopropyl spermidine synthase family protein [Pseudonocardiaceae bacterium]
MSEGIQRPAAADPAPGVVELVASYGAEPRRIRAILARLCTGWAPFGHLVRETASPRRAVERLLDALGDDVERHGDAVRIRPAARAHYLDLSTPQSTPLADPLDELVGAHPDLLATLTDLIDEVPPPLAALDHVAATPVTVLRRALWMSTQYELDGAKIVLLGDHDLTSLAVRSLHPRADITVVDLDERLLAYVDRQAGDTVRVLHADLRFGLPRAAIGHADLVFSDPPYTPEGMGLFAARGIECLANPAHGRLVLAYGYSALHPTLGAQVQRELIAQGLVFEALIPAFHRYLGAQAVGSSADLYVCRPAASARKSAVKSRSGRGRTAIYTHGAQSVEATGSTSTLRDALAAAVERHGARLDGGVRGPDWTAPLAGADAGALAMDLAADPGPWLLRALLARNARHLALLVPNNHADLANEEGQRQLRELVQVKYRLRMLRSTPDNAHAVVIADLVPTDDLDAAAHAVRIVLSKAHGKLGNVLRDAMIERAGRSGTTLTKNQARARIAEVAADAGIRDYEIEARLIDLPRHRVRTVLDALRRCGTTMP